MPETTEKLLPDLHPNGKVRIVFINVAGGIIKGTGIEWKGWHGFRRGLATNLFDLGVHPKLIAAILRHSDVATTMKHYIKENGH